MQNVNDSINILWEITRNSLRISSNYAIGGSEAVIMVDGHKYLVSVKPIYDEECEHLNQSTRTDDGHEVVDCDDCGAEVEV